MNKRDIINMCLEGMRERSKITNALEFHYASINGYYDCKAAASKAGYTGECFVLLWNQACKLHARELNIREVI